MADHPGLDEPMRLPSNTTVATVGDANVCGPCRERGGKAWHHGDAIDHPACENPNGCRCVIAFTLEDDAMLDRAKAGG